MYHHVAMGEIGAIMGRNPLARYLATLGASPCVIFALWFDHEVMGTVSILAHVHRGSKVSDLQEKIDRLIPVRTKYRAVGVYIVTELFKDTHERKEAAAQLQLIERLTQVATILFPEVAVKQDLKHSAARLDHVDGMLTPYGDDDAPFADLWFQHVFRITNREREFQFDRELQAADNATNLRGNIAPNEGDVD